MALIAKLEGAKELNIIGGKQPTFIALIPKLGGANELKDYRPKALASRLKVVLKDVVEANYVFFLEGKKHP